MRNFQAIFLLLVTQILFSQIATGTVYDLASGELLIGASVYLDGTSIGTITDDKGHFSMYSDFNSNANLIVAFIGYETYVLSNNEFAEGLQIGLEEASFTIPGVVLISDPFSRQQKLEVFRLEFLGESKAAKASVIENEDDIELYFDSKDNTLNAYAQTPIFIANDFLGYDLKFDLIDFKIQFSRKSLERLDNMKSTTIHGYSFFKNKGVEKDFFSERRAKIYLGSAQHFIKTLWNQNWNEENFEIRNKGKKVNPSAIFNISLGNDLLTKNVRLTTDKIVIKYKKGVLSYRSTLEVFNGSSFRIDASGNYQPYNILGLGGHMGSFRVADLLPSNYSSLKSLE